MIEFTAVTQRVDETVALRQFSLDVAAREAVGLVAPCSVGGVICRMLMGRSQPASGTIRVAGFDCFAESAEVRRRMGFVGTRPRMPATRSGYEILECLGRQFGLARSAATVRAFRLLDEFGLAGVATLATASYQPEQLRRLATACAVVHDPAVMLFVAPAAKDDIPVLRECVTVVRRWGKTVMLIGDDAAAAQSMCSRVSRISDGDHSAYADHGTDRRDAYCSSGEQ
jgi:ABC-2 type transport system ATP-binding protein